MQSLLYKQKQYYDTGITKDYTFRKQQLIKLKHVIISHEKEITEALCKDLGKSSFESYTTEIGFCLHSISRTLRHLKRWMKPKKVKTPLFIPMTKSYIQHEPLGNVLILGPYNYPFQLVIEPLIGAIAAGNTAIIKPSEVTFETEKVVAKIINQAFESFYIHVVTGNHIVANALTQLPFDHIFFTGSTKVGQMVYENASRNLVPVTLELGGKSPTIVDQTAHVKHAARRIVFGKFLNAGQTCIAPDYIYAHEDIKDSLIEALKIEINKFYPSDQPFGKIVNKIHFERLQNLMHLKKIVHGGVSNDITHIISPTLMDDITWDDGIMQEEIFGPILPILTFKSIEDVIETLKQKDKPLALYLFSKNKQTQHLVFKALSFGGGAINDVLMHVSNPHLPFGGIGKSGIGRYHGRSSFELFSNAKGYVIKSDKFDLPIAYPPYSNSKIKLVKKIFK
jgi:aldehyde dehydrogenase (NAD+)